jgi:hypothetical protein
MTESSIWTQLVGRYFEAAALALDPTNVKGGTFRHDQAAVKAVAGRQQPLADRAAVLADWLVAHRAARGVAKPAAAGDADPARGFALSAAAEALPVLDRLSESDIPAAFVILRAAIAHAFDPKDDTKRSLLNITSKLLWCRFPESAPIYDPAAANAVAFLVKLLKTVEIARPYTRLDEERRYDDHDGYAQWDPNNKKMVDAWYYKDYVQSRAVLYARCHDEIVRRIVAAGPSITTASPFQVFDKILWLLGDHRHDYSLKGSGLS